MQKTTRALPSSTSSLVFPTAVGALKRPHRLKSFTDSTAESVTDLQSAEHTGRAPTTQDTSVSVKNDKARSYQSTTQPPSLNFQNEPIATALQALTARVQALKDIARSCTGLSLDPDTQIAVTAGVNDMIAFHIHKIDTAKVSAHSIGQTGQTTLKDAQNLTVLLDSVKSTQELGSVAEPTLQSLRDTFAAHRELLKEQHRSLNGEIGRLADGLSDYLMQPDVVDGGVAVCRAAVSGVQSVTASIDTCDTAIRSLEGLAVKQGTPLSSVEGGGAWKGLLRSLTG